jgi:hypothetical protein
VTATPIYDELREEMRCAPLCHVCGDVDLFNSPMPWRTCAGVAAGGGCANCFMLGQLDPGWIDAWNNRHCYDCGEYLRVTFIVETREVPDRLAVFVCADHFASRVGKYVVWDPTHIADAKIVDELPPPERVFPQLTTSSAIPMGGGLMFDPANPPWGTAPTVIYDELNELAGAC